MLFVQEGPPLAQQMALFVATYLGDRYVTHRSNRVDQAIYALVRRNLADVVQPWLPKGSTVEKLWRNIPYYPPGSAI